MTAYLLDNCGVRTATTGTGTTLALGEGVKLGHQRLLTFPQANAVHGTRYAYRIVDGEGYETCDGAYDADNNTIGRTTYQSFDGRDVSTSPLDLSGNAFLTVVPRAEDLASFAQLQNDVEDAQAAATASAASAAAAAASAVIATSSSPIGSIVEWPLASPPTNWLICDGTAVSRTLWPLLFALYGVTFGAGDGVNTFNLPDFRGKFVIQVDGSHAIRTTGGAASGTTSSDGDHAHTITVANHTLTTAEMPAHHHGVAATGGGGSTYLGSLAANANATTINSTDTGGDGGHNHTASSATTGAHTHTVATVPPYVALHRIVRAG